jgi:signal peptidase I, archaeal type
MGKSLAELEAAFRTQYPKNANREVKKEENVQESREVKRFADIQASSSAKDKKEVEDFADIKVTQSTKNTKGAKSLADIQAAASAKNTKGVKGFTDIQTTQSAPESKGVKSFADIQAASSAKESKGVKSFADIQATQGMQESKGVRSFADIQATPSVKDSRGAKGLADIQVTSSMQDTRDSKKRVKKNGAINCTPRAFFISEIIFYISLVTIILFTVLFSGGLLGDKALGGRRFIEMSTSSMESVYPKGSLLIVQEVDTSELEVGDDISFVKDALVSVTHRIVEVREDEEAQTQTFVTQGVDNPSDEDEVLAGNVIGRVDSSISGLGSVLSGITRNLNYIIGTFVVLMLASFGIKLFGRQEAVRPKRVLAE